MNRLCRLAVVVAGMLAGCCTPPETAASRPITMMSLNIRIGCGLKDPFKLPKRSLGYLPQCAEVIKAANPDWVAIQEIDRCADRVGGVDQTAELAKLCGMKGTFVRFLGLAATTAWPSSRRRSRCPLPASRPCIPRCASSIMK